MLENDDTIASVLADYRAAWAEADEIAAPYDLDDLATHNRRGPLTLRWIYVHMVEELAGTPATATSCASRCWPRAESRRSLSHDVSISDLERRRVGDQAPPGGARERPQP